MSITTVGFDADDTLWHNETIFRLTHDRFCDLLAGVADREVLEARLAEVERRNLRLYGYGVKGFTLSMIETAMELTHGEAPAARLVLITKGDLLHQEQKLAASGLGDLFVAVEIVSEKDASTYDRVFARHGSGAAQAAMCGNSLRSDILPALEAGAWAAHVPYPLTWAHEMADAPQGHPRFAELASIAELPGWLAAVS